MRRSLFRTTGRRLLPGLMLLALGLPGRGDETPPAAFELLGRAEPGAVRLKWAFDRWPDELDGLVLQRRALDPVPGPWMTVSRAPLRPQTLPDRDWSAIEPRAGEHAILRARLDEQLASGRLRAMGPEAFIQALRSDTELCKTLGDRIHNAWEFPYIVGAAFTDADLPEPGRYEYVLQAAGSDEALARCVVTVSQTEPEYMRLYGERADGTVRLLWLPRAWPAGLDGVLVKRRAPGGDWQPLIAAPIAPQSDPARDWSLTGLDPREQARLKQRLEAMIREGQINPLSAGEATERLVTLNRKQISGDLLRLMGDYEYALITGFATVDSAPPVGVVEYGVFGVGPGVEEDKPLSAFTLHEGLDNNPVEVATEKTAQGIILRWTMAQQDCEERALAGFEVLRSPDVEPPLYAGLTPTVVGYTDQLGDRYQWKFFDQGIDGEKPWRYALRPVTMFQQRREPIEVAYEPQWSRRERFQKLAELEVETVTQPREGVVAVSWRFPESLQELITGFVVERAELPDREMVVVSPDLPPDARAFEDRITEEDGTALAYRVTALGADGPLRNSASVVMIYRDMRRPPRPENLRARLVEDTDPPSIEIAWDPLSADDELTEGFMIFADRIKEGEVLRLAGEGLLTTNRFRIAASDRAGRAYTIRVAARSRYGVKGPDAEVVIEAPLRHLPRVRELQGGFKEDGLLDMGWTYDAVPGLAGFRIYDQDVLLADEDSLGPQARSWTTDRLAPNVYHRLTVVAVADNGVAARPSGELAVFRVDAEALDRKDSL